VKALLSQAIALPSPPASFGVPPHSSTILASASVGVAAPTRVRNVAEPATMVIAAKVALAL
jgi:hypothetical protein